VESASKVAGLLDLQYEVWADELQS